MEMLHKHWEGVVAALAGSGGIVALLLNWRKPRAETDALDAEAALARAEADDISWRHLLETVERLEKDVDNLKVTRDGLEVARLQRDKQIASLQRANRARKRDAEQCRARERVLIARVKALEEVIKQ